jgi:ferrous-iron efflux pump FieF
MLEPVGKELRAIQLAIATSVIGAITKFVAGFITGSMSMISSAVDSVGDLIVSIVNLFVVRYADRGPDEDHNYGHAKIEGLGAMLEGGFIFAAGGFIIYEAIHKALIGETSHDSILGIAVMIPVLAMTTGTVLYLRRVAKATGSLVVRSDALHYATDVYVNIGVLISLVLVKLTGEPLVDTVISVGIAGYMLYSSLSVVRAGFDVVMDKSLDPEVVKQITALLGGCAKMDSFHDLKTRRGRIPHVDFHIVVGPETTTKQVHDLFLELAHDIRLIAGPATKVLMHADPAGVTSRS